MVATVEPLSWLHKSHDYTQMQIEVLVETFYWNTQLDVDFGRESHPQQDQRHLFLL